MGYCMNMNESRFGIKQKNVLKTIRAIQALAGEETISDSSGRHFSWVDNNFGQKPDLPSMMRAWRWSVEVDAKGDVVSIEFRGEKMGDDNVLFDAIAPFVESGSFIEMQGEDGCLWRWKFDGKKCVGKTATITW